MSSIGGPNLAKYSLRGSPPPHDFGSVRHTEHSHRPVRSACQNTETPTSTTPGSLFWRKLGQRTTSLLQQIPVVSAKPLGPPRTVTPSSLRGTKLGATRRGSTLCCSRPQKPAEEPNKGGFRRTRQSGGFPVQIACCRPRSSTPRTPPKQLCTINPKNQPRGRQSLFATCENQLHKNSAKKKTVRSVVIAKISPR